MASNATQIRRVQKSVLLTTLIVNKIALSKVNDKFMKLNLIRDTYWYSLLGSLLGYGSSALDQLDKLQQDRLCSCRNVYALQHMYSNMCKLKY